MLDRALILPLSLSLADSRKVPDPSNSDTRPAPRSHTRTPEVSGLRVGWIARGSRNSPGPSPSVPKWRASPSPRATRATKGGAPSNTQRDPSSRMISRTATKPDEVGRRRISSASMVRETMLVPDSPKEQAAATKGRTATRVPVPLMARVHPRACGRCSRRFRRSCCRVLPPGSRLPHQEGTPRECDA